jgi:ATP-dependent Clp protease adaptor protein ClpS
MVPTDPNDPKNPNDPIEQDDGGDVDVELDTRTSVPRRYKVLFHNDDYTTMEFVIDALMRFFQKTPTEATHVMLTVHNKGYGVAGVYTRDIAESKVARVMDHARENGMPLLVTAEPE